jgi:uncharacterized protein (TIGR01777 family)
MKMVAGVFVGGSYDLIWLIVYLSMNILIAGGTGFIGSYLKSRFEQDGDSVRIVSRSKGDVPWDEESLLQALNKSDVLINLAGKSIQCRFTAKAKEEILRSRLDTTSLLNRVVSKCDKPPQLWINASATAIYNNMAKEPQNEFSAKSTNRFLGHVVDLWEKEFFSVEWPAVRKVALRTAVVLGKNGGVFPLMNQLAKFGLGGKQGNGNQMFSWILIEDYYRIIRLVVEHDEIVGVLNAAAPNPVSNREWMRQLRASNHRWLAIPAPKIVLSMASYVLNFEPELVLDSTNVISKKLNDLNFEMIAPSIDMAINYLNEE